MKSIILVPWLVSRSTRFVHHIFGCHFLPSTLLHDKDIRDFFPRQMGQISEANEVVSIQNLSVVQLSIFGSPYGIYFS